MSVVPPFPSLERLGNEPDGYTVGLRAVRVTPPVSPETRLTAPGADGPNVVPNELSLIA